ncbi:MAG: FAD-dependent oxidoreductase [Actinomycetota bacterium]|nr:FAD-dependent oxidoreductase [Actinomycetota bacterium]MDH5225048.1 FAD-dependent oxidoreductase [Actinomycetota bacterium]MDH5313888.1 FAD-dependent oxidoreductase [Actinomycetota bacterium]
MTGAPRVVIVGAGIVGASAADELTSLGLADVTVLDRGPLFHSGGSTFHAPGLVSRTSVSRMMASFAIETVDLMISMEHPDGACFDVVGALEVATTEERLEDLRRKRGWAESLGIEARIVDVETCLALHPLIDPGRIVGGFHIPGDGLAHATRATEARASRAVGRGARFFGDREVTSVDVDRGRVTGVHTADGERFAADVVVCAAGIWGPRIASLVGMRLPMLPLAHLYARTGPVEGFGEPGMEVATPILRHLDGDLYFRQHGDAVGIGSFQHRALPIDPQDTLAGEPSDSMLPFTHEDFEGSWKTAVELLPRIAGAGVAEAFDGVFSFTPDGFPLIGESLEARGFWVAESVWITHSAGAARALAESIVLGQSQVDMHEADVHRFEPFQRSTAYYVPRSITNHDEVYDVHHPLEPVHGPRPLRASPWIERQRALGAVFVEGQGWERPAWFEANAELAHRLELEVAPRDDWHSRWWSPIAVAEHVATRRNVGLFDLTPLRRVEVDGPGAPAWLSRVCSAVIDRPVGSVAYTLVLGPAGTVRTDAVVSRLGEGRFVVGLGSPVDVAMLLRELPDDGSVSMRDVTAGTCALGLWGPRAADVLAPLVSTGVEALDPTRFRVHELDLAGVPVTAQTVSYVGERGWELVTSADLGLRLWDLLWDVGVEHDLVAAGRRAFDTMRLEAGYPAAGLDVTAEHGPVAAGLDRFVRDRDITLASDERKDDRVLVRLELEGIASGGEPVRAGAETIGYVTSGGRADGAGMAFAWLDRRHPPEVDVVLFDRVTGARVLDRT